MFVIVQGPGVEADNPQIAYNPARDEYLVVWRTTAPASRRYTSGASTVPRRPGAPDVLGACVSANGVVLSEAAPGS
jgi:hypothetical protein